MTASDDTQALSFGADAAGYDAGRLSYPEALWQRLAGVGLGQGARVFEIGAGTGLATRRVLGAGAARVTAIEPDPRMAERLATLPDPACALVAVVGRFEEATLAPGAYDLGVAATAFHWCDSAVASAAAFAALRPGGALALFWNVYQTVEGQDAFSRAAAGLLAEADDDGAAMAAAIAASLPDLPRYRAALGAAGFQPITTETITWQAEHDSTGMVALYASFSVVRGLPQAARDRFLEGIRTLAEGRFGGRLKRTYHTPLLIALKPLD
ncbi:MAG: methyltransferase domain-containing protein [Pseudomonadota bacterium]